MNLVLNPLEVGHFFYKLRILVSYLSTTISELFCVGVGVKRLFRSLQGTLAASLALLRAEIVLKRDVCSAQQKIHK